VFDPDSADFIEVAIYDRGASAPLRHDPSRERLRDWDRDAACAGAKAERLQQHLYAHAIGEMRSDQLPGATA
jgi:hypothetical protein